MTDMNNIRERNKKRSKGNGTYRRPFVKVVGLILATPVLILLLLIGFLYLGTFDNQYTPQTLSNYISEIGTKESETIQVNGETITVMVPGEVIATEAWLRFRDITSNSRYKIENVGLNDDCSKILVNGTYFGIKVPISLDFSPTFTEGALTLDFQEVTFGEKGLSFKNSACKRILKTLVGNNSQIYINQNALLETDLVKISGFTAVDGQGQFTLTVDTPRVLEELQMLKESKNEEIAGEFEYSDDANKQLAAELLSQEDVGDEELRILIKDFMNTQEITRQLFTMADINTFHGLYEKYKPYLSDIRTESVLITQMDTLKEPLTDVYTDLMNQISEIEVIDGKLLVKNGQLFNTTAGATVTIQDLITMSELSVSESLRGKMDFVYDASRMTWLLSYNLNSQQMLLCNSENIWMIEQNDFTEEFTTMDLGEPDYVVDAIQFGNIEKLLIEELGTTKCFIRYLKADQKYAYAVVSAAENYQVYKVYALEFIDGIWNLIPESPVDKASFNLRYPDFNLDLMLDVSDVTLYEVTDEMLQTIDMDMRDRGIIEEMDIQIDYVSYGNQYIALLLSNGEKYIYRLNKKALEAVYSEERALSAWEDIPDLITIQEALSNQ